MDTRQKIQRENDIDNEGILLKIKNIGEQYLACRPAREIADAVEALLPDLDEVMLVEVAFQNPTARAFPPHKDYRLSVLKTLISRLDGHWDLGDALYTELSTAMSAESHEGFVTYSINEKCGSGPFHVTLKENRAFASQGLKSWPASRILLEVLLRLGNFSGRRILELGSGVGLTGLCVLKARPLIESFTFTDCHAAVLDTLRENIQINLSNGDTRARVQLLDWCVGGHISDNVLIVGADIVFDRDIISSLVNLITGFLTQNNSCEAIIANIIRNNDTYSTFRTAIKNHCIVDTIEVKEFWYFDKVIDDYEVIRIKSKLK
ncbi:putative protein N-methyltransferase FAM86B2 isoform X2 [Varroa destructor]|uniref:Uncharacterized protein n=1 Tax=Varroa destructor TaxID=109461 RepID=A0A7M7MHX5_VARDE|nr:putative protein N-methyltransferase FAM86B2 isoform X2 [Varroa destructor]